MCTHSADQESLAGVHALGLFLSFLDSANHCVSKLDLFPSGFVTCSNLNFFFFKVAECIYQGGRSK